jgi:hypothetical protein
MTKYLAEVRRMEKFFNGFEVRYVPRLDNTDADYLTWIASSRAPTPPDVIIEKLTKYSIKLVEKAIDAAKLDLMVIDEHEKGLAYDWMSPIKMFLNNQPPSDDNAEVDVSRANMSHPGSRKQNRSLHTCVQDVQITHIVTIW